MKKGIIFLIGMPGSGKSYWGKRIAENYGLPWLDLDHYIENKEREAIKEVIKRQGESGFRKIEKTALEEVLKQQDGPFVLSCGGGTPLDPENLELMKQTGCVIYLEATVDTLLNNLGQNINDRPLLDDGGSIKVRLSILLAQRKDLYAGADYTLKAEGLSMIDFKNIIDGCIKTH